MRLNLCPQTAGVALLLSAPVFAYHSFEAQYDSNKPINITGSVTKVEWMNPHGHFYVDVCPTYPPWPSKGKCSHHNRRGKNGSALPPGTAAN